MIAEEEDLYDDLYEDVGDMLLPRAPFQSFHENDTREEEFKKKESELNGKVESLLKEVEALQQDKAVLTRNISCLFKTAQMELARKDKQMKELRDENLRFKLGGTRGPNNVRPHLTKAVSVDKISVQGKTGEKNHHNSSPVGTPDARSSDKPPYSQDSRLHYQGYTVVSNDRVAQESLSIQLSNRGQTFQCHVLSPKSASEAAIVDTAHEQAVEMDSNEQSKGRRRPDSLVGAKVSARMHEPDSDGRRQSSDEGKNCRSPSRGLLDSSYQHRDIDPDGSRRTADSFNKQRSTSNDKEGRSDQQRDRRYDDTMRHADYGHTKHRSPDSSRDRGRDRRVDGNLRNSDNRKRHRSVSRERDARPEDRKSSRAAKAANRSGSESSREAERPFKQVGYHR